MKRKFSRRGKLVLLPLAFGALIGGIGSIRWKQLHPAPTMLDLQERSLLSEAVDVKIYNPTYCGQVPVDDFRNALDDFYLPQDDEAKFTDVAPPRQFFFVVTFNRDPNQSESGAVIGVSPLGYYRVLLREHVGRISRTGITRPLPPVTRRRFEKLLEESVNEH